MPFMRLSIPGGQVFKLGKKETYAELIDRALAKTEQVQVLETGEYNLTPKAVPSEGNERLIIHEDDTATFVDSPPQGSALLDTSDEILTLQPKSNRRTLPEDDTLIAIATPVDDNSVRLFEVVKYVGS